MPLSEDEQRILEQIAAEFHEQDPVLAGELENTTLWSHAWRRMKWAGILFAVGVGVLVIALATASSFVISFAGFLVMLVSALWFEHNTRRLGRAGWQHYRQRGGSDRIRSYFDAQQDRLKDRFHRDE